MVEDTKDYQDRLPILICVLLSLKLCTISLGPKMLLHLLNVLPSVFLCLYIQNTVSNLQTNLSTLFCETVQKR